MEEGRTAVVFNSGATREKGMPSCNPGIEPWPHSCTLFRPLVMGSHSTGEAGDR